MNAACSVPGDLRSARIGRLVKLPVFYDLEGRSAVVVGGSAAAAWKAELLAAAGAEVTVLAEAAHPEMLALVEAAAGRIGIVPRAWSAGDFGDAAIVVADAGDEAEAARLHRAVRVAGAPINVIDRPAFCDFQFGSIVNRSPVIVAISTDGASPILTQAIRRRIEPLLPGSLGRWAEAAKGLRTWIAAQIADPGLRRTFWERFADIAFSTDPGPAAERQLSDLAAGIAAHSAGIGGITFVAADPVDSELLTLKAVRTLQSADVIFCDDDIGDDVLELARREAKRISVSMCAMPGSCRPKDVQALMMKHAGEGKRVVRLFATHDAHDMRDGTDFQEGRRQARTARSLAPINAHETTHYAHDTNLARAQSDLPPFCQARLPVDSRQTLS